MLVVFAAFAGLRLQSEVTACTRACHARRRIAKLRLGFELKCPAHLTHRAMKVYMQLSCAGESTQSWLFMLTPWMVQVPSSK